MSGTALSLNEMHRSPIYHVMMDRTLLLELMGKLSVGVLLMGFVFLSIKRPISAADGDSSSSFNSSEHLDHAGVSSCVCPMSDRTMNHCITACKRPGVLTRHLHLVMSQKM